MQGVGALGRGAEADYVLGTPFGWDAFSVVRWHATEAISTPFRFEVVLCRAAERGPVAIHDLVDRGATFRIASRARWRQVHGVIAEAELLEASPTLLLYRLVLVPHLWRSLHRTHFRCFVDQSLEQIVARVLENRSAEHPSGLRGLLPIDPRVSCPPATEPSFGAFEEPVGRYRWALVDSERAERPRVFVVQYDETDLDFVSRLLEAEGISYRFDHEATQSVLCLTDHPAVASPFDAERQIELVSGGRGGRANREEIVRFWRAARRLRAASVTMRDYAWRRSATRLEARAAIEGAGQADLDHFEFPAADEDDRERPCATPARLLLDRYRAEGTLSVGSSTARCHEPGRRFTLRDRAGIREDQELLVVTVETYAVQLLPELTLLDSEPFGFAGAHAPEHAFFECRFQSVDAELPYRPARRTPKPRIDGVQTARVTAEEVVAPSDSAGPELNSDDFGRVRVRFPWDQRPADGTPSSKWIRVSQPWAGPSFGAMYVPRVGHEVLVAFERGDPDRPIVVGRLYNAQSPPPYAEPNTTKTTVKSDSVHGDGRSADGFNELRFDDRADEEQVFLHAQRNLDEVVRACHTTSVGGDQSNSVGGNQSNTVARNRTHTVSGGLESVHVAGNRTTSFGGSETHSVGEDRHTFVSALDHLEAGRRETAIATTDDLSVGAARNVHVEADHSVKSDASYHSSASANHTFDSTNMYITQAGAFQVNSTTLWLNVGGASLKMGGGMIALDSGGGAQVNLVGDMVMLVSGRLVSLGGPHSVVATGATSVTSGGPVNVLAPDIKLNG